MSVPDSLAKLETEAIRPELSELDLLPVTELVEHMAKEAVRPQQAVAAAAEQIAQAVMGVVGRLEGGGRLFYVGAGSAGRIGILDAAEAGPTFDVADGLIVGLIAGGPEAVFRAKEGAEDAADAGAASLQAQQCSDKDAVVGISASGHTHYVRGAVSYGHDVGAFTVAIVCNPNSAVAGTADVAIELLVGGEVIAGSTRLNAGTAQKMTLNIISTAAMIQLGKTYGNLMVDLRATNAKLRDRAVRIVVAVTGAIPSDALATLERCDWHVKLACAVIACGVGPERAAELLAAHGLRLRPLLEQARTNPG